jgi:hypothetical protein
MKSINHLEATLVTMDDLTRRLHLSAAKFLLTPARRFALGGHMPDSTKEHLNSTAAQQLRSGMMPVRHLTLLSDVQRSETQAQKSLLWSVVSLQYTTLTQFVSSLRLHGYHAQAGNEPNTENHAPILSIQPNTRVDDFFLSFLRMLP